MYAISNMENLSIFSFTWNCESLKTCKYDSKCRDKLGEICSYCTKEKCYIPTFASYLAEYVNNNDYDIVFISTQEDPYPYSNLHSDYLIKIFKEKDYHLLKDSRARYMGVGKTTLSTGLMRGLRSSVYFRKSFLDTLKEKKIKIKINNDTFGCGLITRNKGGLCINVSIDGKNYSFINCHMPFKSSTLKVYKKKKNYDKYRLPAVKDQNKCLHNVIQKFKKKFKSNFMIVQGDLNYRIKYIDDESSHNIHNKLNTESDLKFLYEERDELHLQMKEKNIPELLEGVNNAGPTFMPTCKMVKHKYSEYTNCNQQKFKLNTNKPERLDCQYTSGNFTQNKLLYQDKHCYKLGKLKQRAPSWCDRILYKNDIKDTTTTCTEYSNYDFSQIMAMSDHTAVYGSFRIFFL
jgi:exonuclease III